MKKREVVFYKWEKVEGQTHFGKVVEGNGVFHQFGSDYEEFESGPGNFSTAIVELSDGSIKNIPVDLVVFND